jgi:hypothetical protein
MWRARGEPMGSSGHAEGQNSGIYRRPSRGMCSSSKRRAAARKAAPVVPGRCPSCGIPSSASPCRRYRPPPAQSPRPCTNWAVLRLAQSQACRVDSAAPLCSHIMYQRGMARLRQCGAPVRAAFWAEGWHAAAMLRGGGYQM